ncbi:hypothetical protein ACLOJK_007463 [Asimina triloba]
MLIRWATDSGGHDLLPLTRLRRMAVTRCPDGLKETCYDLDFCLDAVDSLQPVGAMVTPCFEMGSCWFWVKMTMDRAIGRWVRCLIVGLLFSCHTMNLVEIYIKIGRINPLLPSTFVLGTLDLGSGAGAAGELIGVGSPVDGGAAGYGRPWKLLVEDGASDFGAPVQGMKVAREMWDEGIGFVLDTLPLGVPGVAIAAELGDLNMVLLLAGYLYFSKPLC